MRTLLIIIGNVIALLIVISAANAQESSGYIYGTVTTYNTSYTGQIRWDDEEAYWNDYFNAYKMGDEYYESILSEKGDNKDSDLWDDVDFFDFASIWENKHTSQHEFRTQFGNIAALEPRSRGRVRLTLKNGQDIDLNGSGTNDVGTTVVVFDSELGDVKLPWNKIDKIEFEEAPRNFEPSGGGPLYGTVETFKGSYTGYVQWDHDERLGNDILDGDNRDGDVKIAFKHIKSIESRGNSCKVILNSGREFRLDGSNDVNGGNRGIIVTVPEIGKIDIPWKVFDRVDFEKTKNTRDAYSNYKVPKGLRGTVETLRGEKYSGRIVYDVDEAWEVETLDANDESIEYKIPFDKIESITPKNSYYSLVQLRSGDRVLLGDSNDVNSSNKGIIIFVSGNREPVYIKWRDVDKVSFD